MLSERGVITVILLRPKPPPAHLYSITVCDSPSLITVAAALFPAMLDLGEHHRIGDALAQRLLVSGSRSASHMPPLTCASAAGRAAPRDSPSAAAGAARISSCFQRIMTAV